jgi:hypothetical protein
MEYSYEDLAIKLAPPTHSIKGEISHGDEPQDEIKDRRSGTVPRNG